MILTKPKSKIHIEVVTDSNDDWFLYINRIETSSGKLKDRSMIIRKDLDNQIIHLTNLGWKIQESTDI